VLGSESHGISEEISALADAKLRLPIGKEMESLNVAIAAGIFLYLFRR
jgi:tRNA G18 (ribose-2'-O)-methylase SpoU